MILFVDTETSGKLNFKRPPEDESQPHIVQLAASLQDGPGSVVAEMNFIIRPVDWQISEEVAAIHGITHARALEYGVERRVVLAIFNQMCKLGRVIVAHNLGFDLPVIVGQYYREARTARLDGLTRVCTMLAATPILKLPKPFKPRYGSRAGDEYKWPTLTETYAYYHDGATFDGAHNAMVDVNACASSYWKMVERGHVVDCR